MSKIQSFLDLLTASNLLKVLGMISVMGYVVFMAMAFVFMIITLFKGLF